jgi:beta-lactamase regulating signal transducer with metallopeptidase domain
MLPWLVGAWAIGVFGFSLRLLGGWLWIRWLVRRGSRPVEERWVESLKRLQHRLQIGRPVRLLESARLQVPLAVGWLRPVILLPVTALTGLPSDQLEAILAHELAHIRRYDYVVNLAQSVVETLLFYHPAAWWISARIRAEREHCCDDWAVEVCGDRLIYARALAALEVRRSTGWLLAPSARDGSLLFRIRRLLGASSPVERPASGLAGTLVLATVALLVVGLMLAPAAKQARAGDEPRDAITGSVETPDGKPVAGADVWLVADALGEGKVVTLGRARTEGDGHFRLVPINERLDLPDLGWRSIYAHKPGTRPTAIEHTDASSELGFSVGVPIRLTLRPLVSTTLAVVDASGKPLAGARVAVLAYKENRTPMPDDLVDRMVSQTGPDGRVHLHGVPLDQIRKLRVSAGSLGIQSFYTRDGFKSDEVLQVRNAVPVVGRVSANDPAAVRGLPVYFTSHVDGSRDPTRHQPLGEAWAVTDDRGRFHVPALATGSFSASVAVPAQALYRAPRISDRDFKASSRIEIEIPLKRMLHVRGVIREKGTGRPIEGVGVSFSSPDLLGAFHFVLTDADGRYDALAYPGSKSYLHLAEPKAYLKRGHGIETVIGETDGQTMPPIELDRGVTLRGIVVDAEDKPVIGAAVEGKWDRISPVNSPNNPGTALGQTFSTTAKTDAQGQFLLEGIHPGANVMLEASESEARTNRPTRAAAGTATLAKLVISAANTVALVGQVVDPTDRPVVGALVQVRSRPMNESGFPETHAIRFDVSEIRTDRDGRFRTPRQLKRGYGYRAEVKSPDETFMPENSPWLAMKAETRPFLPKIVLRRLRTVTGRVLDTHGKPVPGAPVRQAGDGPVPTQVVTDSDGRFALPGVLAEPAFICVAKDRYQFAGTPLTATDAAVEVTLVGVDESYPERLKSPQPSLSRAEELAVLHRVFDAYAVRVIKEGSGRELFDVLGILLRFDPARAIELLNDQRLEPWQPDNIRFTLATLLVRQDDKEARELIEAIQDTNMRSYAYSEASFALPDSARARKLDLLNESLIAGRAVVDPGARVLRLADIGGRLFDMGQTEQATKVVQEALPIAVNLTNAWPRGRLAEELAQVDLPAALKLLEGTESDREHDRYLGRIAHEIAGRNPAEAEKVLMMIRDVWPHFRDEHTQKVCYRMVPVDPKRAMALVAAMKDYRHRARALGAMALSLENTKEDHATAVRLLDEAFQVLNQAVEARKDDWDRLGMACTAAAGLLPIVTQVDPRRLSEFVWRTLALRPPIPGPNGRDGISNIANARVAAMIARYDRPVARQVLKVFADRALADRIGLEDWGPMFRAEGLFEAAAVVDPATAAAMIDSLPEPAGLSTQELKNAARAALAQILARSGDDRWRYVERTLLHLWPIDSEQD